MGYNSTDGPKKVHKLMQTSMGRRTGQYYEHFLNMLNSYLA